MKMSSVEEEQVVKESISSTWQVPFFDQYQISLPVASSSEIATLSFASLTLTGIQSLFGRYHKYKLHHPNH